MNEPHTTLPIGHVLEGRYRIISEGIARDIGTEYKAYDLRRERLAAITCLARHLGGGPGTVERLAAANQVVADLAQDVANLSELAVVPYDRIGLWYGQFYVARRHIKATSLADLLAAHAESLSVEAVVDLGIRLCQALVPAHRAGLVHGGLSPDSVLVGDRGEVYVLDTGLLPALRPPASPASPRLIWGRAPYLSPEQAAGRDALPGSDVYVIGSLIYFMLAGRPPFAAHDLSILAVQHLRQDPPSLPVLVPNVPPALAQIVHRALAKEPAARYRNAGQLGHILQAQLQTLTTAAPPPAYVAPPPVPAEQRAGQTTTAQPAVVPPPPEAWREEQEKVDWLLVGLIVVALIAVLGLIPLWRTVYRLYSVPPPAPAPAPSGRLNLNPDLKLAGTSGHHHAFPTDSFQRARLWHCCLTQTFEISFQRTTRLPQAAIPLDAHLSLPEKSRMSIDALLCYKPGLVRVGTGCFRHSLV